MRVDRVRGALLGVHAGDALGAALEFSSHPDIRIRHPEGLRDIIGGGPFAWRPGQATDDTDLTRAVVRAYLRPEPDLLHAVADEMVRWFTGDGWPEREPGSAPLDIGGATRVGLDNYLRDGDPRFSGAGHGSAGNGSLMRAIPTACARKDRVSRVAESIAISSITHDDPRCTISCAVYNEIAAALLDGVAAPKAVQAGRDWLLDVENDEVLAAVDRGALAPLAAMAQEGPDEYLLTDGSGFVLDSLSIAISAVLDSRPLEDVVVDVVRIGRDTDTNAAIAGGLVGARDGVAAIPDRWLQLLQFRNEFWDAATTLLHLLAKDE